MTGPDVVGAGLLLILSAFYGGFDLVQSKEVSIIVCFAAHFQVTLRCSMVSTTALTAVVILDPRMFLVDVEQLEVGTVIE